MPNAPFSRSLALGAKGNDVWVVQDALRAWGKAKRPKDETEVRRYAPTGTMAMPTVVQVKHFQKLHAIDQSGVVGQRTWNQLEPFMTTKDVALATDFWARNHALTERQAIGQAAMNAYAHRASIHYVMTRKMTWWLDGKTKSADELHSEDCSALATWTYFVGTNGTVDPNGLNFNGLGNTDTMLEHGTFVSGDKVQVGDLALYRDPGHVAIVTRIDYRGIYVVSNGHYPMSFTHYNYGHPFVGFKSYIKS